MKTKFEPELEVRTAQDLENETSESIMVSIHKPGNIDLFNQQLERTARLAGVFCKGVQYYDFKNVTFISNTDLANLIEVLKALLKQGVTLQFVNVNEKIKDKIRSMGLESIFNCS